MSYSDFLARKQVKAVKYGPTITAADVNSMLFDWQAEIVAWAANVGRAAIWADTGLGKTLMQVEWARIVARDGVAIIAAPLAVCHQTVREAGKIDVPARYVRHQSEIDGPGIYVTNYEMLAGFDPDTVDALVLDESSILKNSSGATRGQLIEWAGPVKHRLACTATPAPNDPEELTNHAEFLGHSTRVNMLAAYFVHDQDGWRLKGHARRPMFKWMSTWALAIRFPSDMGYPDDGYILPGLEIHPEIVDVKIEAEDQLFATDIGGVGGRARVRKQTLAARVARAAELVNATPDEPWIVWCGLNDEADALARLIPDAINVHGSMDPEEKARHLLGFADGDHRALITKPGIASQGLNYQHCARMAFVGLSDSYEQYYQAIRRCYRFGQTRVVHAHVVLSEIESQIATNVARKEREAATVTSQLIDAMNESRKETTA